MRIKNEERKFWGKTDFLVAVLGWFEEKVLLQPACC
jgi:hypothetical protein